MNITILKQAAGQTIPRPYNRAISVDEMIDLLHRPIIAEAQMSRVGRETLERIARQNLDTEEPVLQTLKGTVRYYAFTEE